jgi:hypothetical protein
MSSPRKSYSSTALVLSKAAEEKPGQEDLGAILASIGAGAEELQTILDGVDAEVDAIERNTKIKASLYGVKSSMPIPIPAQQDDESFGFGLN